MAAADTPDLSRESAIKYIEVDGPVHDGLQERDQERQHALEKAGYRVLRFSNESVMNALPTVLDQIRKTLETST